MIMFYNKQRDEENDSSFIQHTHTKLSFDCHFPEPCLHCCFHSVYSYSTGNYFSHRTEQKYFEEQPPPSERNGVVEEGWREIWYPLMCFLWAPLLISMKTESHFPLRLGVCTFDCYIPGDSEGNSTENSISIGVAVVNRFSSDGVWSSCAPAQKGYRPVS